MPGHDIIVVGASAGGVEALMNLARSLPADLPAAVFVVLHIPPYARSALPQLLTRAGPLPAVHPTDQQTFEPGHIYIAPPDYHMLVANEHIHLVQGPKENRTRPAIDPLFRTAARTYGPRVVGVVLTGMLDDGTAGLLSIKHRGGVAVVQDPLEALFSDMPQSASTYVDIDYLLPLHEMGALLADLACTEIAGAGAGLMEPDDDPEADIAEIETAALEQTKERGTVVPLSCPDCGGVLLSFYEGDFLRFRCQVGHAYSPQSLLSGHTERVDRVLWDGFNMLDEQVTLLRQLTDHAEQRGMLADAHRFKAQMKLLDKRKEEMRQLLLDATSIPDSDLGNS